jgi:prepilin-type N-terminal cleavage/methylation domain-containing protein
MNNNGWTLIETLIVMAIIGILVALIVPNLYTPKDDLGRPIQNKPVQDEYMKCIGGYKFAVGSDDKPVQIINSEGKGISCQ